MIEPEPLHNRILAYFARLSMKKPPHSVIQDMGITLSKEIDKANGRIAALEKAIADLVSKADAQP